MGCEKAGFRDTLAQLNARFPDKELLNIAETMAFTGLSRSTVTRKIRFHPTLKRISKADLARQICV